MLLMETVLSSLEVQQSVTGWVLDETVGPDAKLRQGDLIRFEGNDNALRQAGIIVTADCDLEQKKHARLVTLVPVVTIQTALEHYLLTEDCERKRPQIEDFAYQKYDIDKRQDRETKLSVLKEAMQGTTINKDDPASIAAYFVLDLSNTISVSSYKVLMAALNMGPKKADALRDQIRGRGDLLILPSAQNLGVVGELAWIRHLWQTPLGDIAIRTSEVSSRLGERVARLDSPYRYRLTQLMAQVFSDIGLPNTPDNVEKTLKDVYSNV
jgi:hypothetical protein